MTDLIAAVRMYEQGLEANEDGNTRGALKCFLKALDMQPDRVPWVLSAANMYVKEGTELEKARELYSRARNIGGLSSRQEAMIQQKLAHIDNREANRLSPCINQKEAGEQAAQFYKQAKNSELSPVLRVSKLNDAIRLWNAIDSKASGCSQAALKRNLGSAHLLLAGLKAPSSTTTAADNFVLEDKMRTFHSFEAVDNFSGAITSGNAEGRDHNWVHAVISCGQDAFMTMLSAVSSEPLDKKLILRSAALKLPQELQLDCLLEVVELIFKHGVRALEESQWNEALKAFHELERPLIEAEQVCKRDHQRNSHARLASLSQVYELRDRALQHAYIAESRRAIAQADQGLNQALRNAENLDMDGVWTALDKYQEAGVLTRAAE